MKKTMKTGIPFILSLLGLSFLAYAGPKDADGITISIAGDTYKIPEEYNACCTSEPDKYGNHNLVIQFAKTDMGPLLENPPGWETNINLLLSDSKFPVSKIYDMQWDGELYPEISKSKMNKIVKITKINDKLSYQEMGGFADIILVVDDQKKFDGFMICDKYDMDGAANGCQFLFNEGGKRWQISMGKQFVEDYEQIRRDVIKRMDSFKINSTR